MGEGSDRMIDMFSVFCKGFQNYTFPFVRFNNSTDDIYRLKDS